VFRSSDLAFDKNCSASFDLKDSSQTYVESSGTLSFSSDSLQIHRETLRVRPYFVLTLRLTDATNQALRSEASNVTANLSFNSVTLSAVSNRSGFVRFVAQSSADFSSGDSVSLVISDASGDLQKKVLTYQLSEGSSETLWLDLKKEFRVELVLRDSFTNSLVSDVVVRAVLNGSVFE
jgi:hypothetical protein